jgi:hypothetical protein
MLMRNRISIRKSNVSPEPKNDNTKVSNGDESKVPHIPELGITV